MAVFHTCLFKTRCFPFQYLSIWRDCSVLTISTGFTAVSWLISMNIKVRENVEGWISSSFQIISLHSLHPWKTYLKNSYLKVFFSLKYSLQVFRKLRCNFTICGTGTHRAAEWGDWEESLSPLFVSWKHFPKFKITRRHSEFKRKNTNKRGQKDAQKWRNRVLLLNHSLFSHILLHSVCQTDCTEGHSQWSRHLWKVTPIKYWQCQCFQPPIRYTYGS